MEESLASQSSSPAGISFEDKPYCISGCDLRFPSLWAGAGSWRVTDSQTTWSPRAETGREGLVGRLRPSEVPQKGDGSPPAHCADVLLRLSQEFLSLSYLFIYVKYIFY